MSAKRLLLLTVAVFSCLVAMAQDVIMFKDGNSRSVKVEAISNGKVQFRFSGGYDVSLYECPLAAVSSITYKSGMVDTFDVKSDEPILINKAITKVSGPDAANSSNEAAQYAQYSNSAEAVQAYMDKERYETSLRRLKVWSKITRIYGYVGVSIGFLCIVSANSIDEDNYECEEDYNDAVFYNRIVGTLCAIEGAAALAVGYSLQVRRNRMIREHNSQLQGMAPLYMHEFKVGNDLSLAPSVNLVSSKTNSVDGLGAGLTIRF
ncbi:MAG: hypothetical protein K6E86_02680 [Bacteroidales bacterium]|nr:hypothetical protein [Bacteroidales bacterium]